MSHCQGHHHGQCQTNTGSHPCQATKIVAFKTKVVIQTNIDSLQGTVTVVAAFPEGGICAVAKKRLIPNNLCSISHFRNTISHNLVSVSHLKIIFGHFGLGWNFIKNNEYAEKQAIMTIFWSKVFLRMPFGPYKSRVSEKRNCLDESNRIQACPISHIIWLIYHIYSKLKFGLIPTINLNFDQINYGKTSFDRQFWWHQPGRARF